MDIEKRVSQFRQVRDQLKAMDDAHDEKRKPFVEIQNLLIGAISDHMKQQNVTSMKTDAGTATIQTRYTASLSDPDAFMGYVIAHSAFELMDRRAHVTAVKDYVQKHAGDKPPGVNLSAVEVLSVTKPRKKTSEIISETIAEGTEE